MGEKGLDRGGMVAVFVPHQDRVPLGDGGPNADDVQGVAAAAAAMDRGTMVTPSPRATRSPSRLTSLVSRVMRAGKPAASHAFSRCVRSADPV